MSGLSRTPGKRVRVNSPPRVRIPPAPPSATGSRPVKAITIGTPIDLDRKVEIYGKRAEESRPIIEELRPRLFHRIDVDHCFANFAADDGAALGLAPSAPCPP